MNNKDQRFQISTATVPYKYTDPCTNISDL